MFVGAGEILNTLIYSFFTSIFAYLVLRLLNEHRSFFRVFLVIFLSDLVMMFLPFFLLQVPLPSYGYFILSLIISLFMYKYGLALSWLHTTALVILTPIVAFVIGTIFSLIGLGILFVS